jgi:hypothetical protein
VWGTEGCSAGCKAEGLTFGNKDCAFSSCRKRIQTDIFPAFRPSISGVGGRLRLFQSISIYLASCVGSIHHDYDN